MGDFFGSIWWLIVSIGVLVTFHEFGHYWVARRCGVRVLRFSVGFGRPLWRRLGRNGTEFVVAAIPLGGYVKFLDEHEGEVAPEDLPQAFNRQSVGKRIAIVAAGPLFNLLLAFLLLWLMFMIGKPDLAPIVGPTTGVAASAGLRLDDRIERIDGEPVETWTHAAIALTTAALDHRTVALEVSHPGVGTRQVPLDLSQVGEIDEQTALADIGVSVRQRMAEPVVGELTAGLPAEQAGLHPGDRILAIDGHPVLFFTDIAPLLQGRPDPGAPATVRIARGAERLELEMRPTFGDPEHSGSERWLFGFGPASTHFDYDVLLRHGPLSALGAAWQETLKLTGTTVGMLKRMVSGIASLKSVAGPVTIAAIANESANQGVAMFLSFLAVLSISLFLMNLLPIPILDGGHLLYYLIELIKGSPVSERALAAGQYVGLALLAGLMGLAFYNDLFIR